MNLISKQRSKVFDSVADLLIIWINEKQLAGDTVSEAIICEKAKNLHCDLLTFSVIRHCSSTFCKAKNPRALVFISEELPSTKI